MGFTLHWSEAKVLVAQSCPTLCDPMDCSLPGSPLHGILQARVLKWVSVPSSRRSSQPKDQTWISCIAGGFFTVWTLKSYWGLIFFFLTEVLTLYHAECIQWVSMEAGLSSFSSTYQSRAPLWWRIDSLVLLRSACIFQSPWELCKISMLMEPPDQPNQSV